ncbi:hypothetical protein Taro_003820 [Colocasia esculenta]|uniref:Uncharacterized protein n=1 Tax=Colocasia esculenta TaxID=4460 RepID=A0A843TGK9_COLES|nr:hypothetical protein [Colocasia esculenta]
MDYGVFMQGLVQAMQMQAHTQAALQAQLEAQDEVLEVDKYHWLGWRLVLPDCAVQESSLYCLGLVGDPTSLDETMESDSERGE